MPGDVVAFVDVSVVFREEIDVVEDEAGVVAVFERFEEADVEEHGSVEGEPSGLFDYEDGVVELLFSEEGVHVFEEEEELLGAVSVGDDYGYGLVLSAEGLVVAAVLDPVVVGFEVDYLGDRGCDDLDFSD